MFAIRSEEMVCQNLRAWQEGTGAQVMQGGGVEEEKGNTDTMEQKIPHAIKSH